MNPELQAAALISLAASELQADQIAIAARYRPHLTWSRVDVASAQKPVIRDSPIDKALSTTWARERTPSFLRRVRP